MTTLRVVVVNLNCQTIVYIGADLCASVDEHDWTLSCGFGIKSTQLFWHKALVSFTPALSQHTSCSSKSHSFVTCMTTIHLRVTLWTSLFRTIY